MKRLEIQSIRLNQLQEQLKFERPVGSFERPSGGWLRAIRQVLGLSYKAVGAKLSLSPQSVHQFEKSEAAGTISLRQLEALADAMGCRLVYALLPREGNLAKLAGREKDELRRSVDHSMALEGQRVEPRDPPAA